MAINKYPAGYFDFFTSDTHFDHLNIITYSNRPFNDVDEMNQGLVDRWNEIVSPDSKVAHLGDVAMKMSGLSSQTSRTT